MSLLIKAITTFLLGLLTTGAMLFLPAGTLAYYGAWLFVFLLFTPIFIVGIVLFLRNPDLLRKRLEMKERDKEQRGVVSLSGLLLVFSLVLSGFDFRFGWSLVPDAVVVLASVLLLVGYVLYAEVLRENVYLSRVVEVQEGQIVIDTGLYGIVRHPMYLAVSLLYIAIPLVLGSWWALLPMSLCVLLLLVRIKNEELLLHQGLPGYTEYTKRVQYRMIPFLW
ncbi:MAG: isoprenylcysteine carboxylmethyltransferase family protein [Bacteroidaceae bacterium]|nr:isoprenylcysteine carboxylmethyltransferase family protein [Bacteroidaceae bacterium]